jgi:glycosyltransferase involved in cell wall biosynthesis
MKLCIVHPMDPWGTQVGGAETFARGLLQFAPEDVEPSLIGIQTARNLQTPPPGTWRSGLLGGRSVAFLPLFDEGDEPQKHLIPLSLRFTLALACKRLDWHDRVVLFNRIEPAVISTPGSCIRVAVIHNDIHAQIDNRNSDVAWRHMPFLYHSLEKRLFRGMDHVFTVHQPTLDHYQKRYAQLQTGFSFQPTWVDTDRFRPSPLPKAEQKHLLSHHQPDLDPRDRWILFSGRFETQKNPLGLIKGFLLALKTHPDLQLLLAGCGSWRLRMEEAARPAAGRIHFLGTLAPEALIPHYQASDLLLLASHYEGMPLAVLEALACGLAVVSPPVGEVPRLVRSGETGELSADTSAEAVARALVTALGRPTPYEPALCHKAITPYTPVHVLPPLFERLRRLSRPEAGAP